VWGMNFNLSCRLAAVSLPTYKPRFLNVESLQRFTIYLQRNLGTSVTQLILTS
jgi:hypothetical protein